MSAVENMLKMTIDGLTSLASADLVIGKSVEINGKTIAPILKLSLGFGGGGGTGQGETPEEVNSRGRAKGKGTGGGFGAGGGAHLTPVALIIKDGDQVKVIRVPRKKRGIEKLFDKIPELVEKFKSEEDDSWSGPQA